MSQQAALPRNVLSLLCLPLVLGCQSTDAIPVSNTVPSSLQVPEDVRRLAVLHGRTRHGDERDAYSRLEGAVFQLKELRPSLRIFDRSHLAAVLREQRFELSGAVSDRTAVRIGRLLGVDSMLIYHIEGPSLRDRMFAEHYDDLPPFLVASKIIRVESGEVVFHNVVTAPIQDPLERRGTHLSSEFSPEPVMRHALERGVAQTVSDLRRAFR